MKTMNIKGVTFHVTESTAAEIQQELDASAYGDFDFWEQQLREEEAVARATGNWEVYSDLFKSLYGIRPRWMWAS